jgi:hypothetical protein
VLIAANRGRAVPDIPSDHRDPADDHPRRAQVAVRPFELMLTRPGHASLAEFGDRGAGAYALHDGQGMKNIGLCGVVVAVGLCARIRLGVPRNERAATGRSS